MHRIVFAIVVVAGCSSKAATDTELTCDDAVAAAQARLRIDNAALFEGMKRACREDAWPVAARRCLRAPLEQVESCLGSALSRAQIDRMNDHIDNVRSPPRGPAVATVDGRSRPSCVAYSKLVDRVVACTALDPLLRDTTKWTHTQAMDVLQNTKVNELTTADKQCEIAVKLNEAVLASASCP